MKRDMDLCRDILIYVEELSFQSQPQKVSINEFSEEEIQYHLKLLSQAGLVDAEDTSITTQSTSWRVHALTWQGHEFIEASRSKTAWDNAKSIVKEKGVGMAFDTLKAILIASAKEAVGL